MRNPIAAAISVSRPCGENLRGDMQQGVGLLVIIRVQIISSYAY